MTIILITASYPSNKSKEKSFLDPEMVVASDLSRANQGRLRVIVAPMSVKADCSLLEGTAVEVVDWLNLSKRAKIQKILYSVSLTTCIHALKMLCSSRWRLCGVGKRLLDVVIWGYQLRLVNRQLEAGLRQISGPVVLYTYWFNGATSACIDLKRKLGRDKVKAVVTRTHGADLYDERQWHPRRFQDVACVDWIFPVSRAGLAYLYAKFGQIQNVSVSYLGILPNSTEPRTVSNAEGAEEILSIVSCGYLVPVKRIPLLCAGITCYARQNPRTRIRWTHYGDGPERPEIEQLLSQRSENLTVAMRGDVENAVLRAELSGGNTDVFMAVSESEGLPVSMMEAAEAGIPIIATAVGGVPELVSSSNGCLLPANPSPANIATAIAWLKKQTWSDLSEGSKAVWRSKFSASENFSRFYQTLQKL